MAIVKTTLREAAQFLAGSSPTPRLDVELLMADALGVSRSDLLLWHQDAEVPAKFTHHLRRRRDREPVAYILGTQEFYGREFAVGPGVLIPRSDSEVLIETAFELKPSARRVLDLGTGSGALLVTALAEMPESTGTGIDASREALVLARQNAGLLDDSDRRIDFLRRSWTQPGWTDDLGTFDLILCNPPYVEDAAELEPDVCDYEPSEALFAGKDGLDDYRKIFPQLGKLLIPGGVAIFEIGHTQADPVTQIAQTTGFSVEIRNDLANRPRCAILR